MAGQASSSSASLGLSARFRKERLGPAVLSGFVATTAMAVVALLAYAIALGLGGTTGNTVQRWLYALAHNPVMTMVHASPLGAVGINLAAGLIWAMFFAIDANDRLARLSGPVRGVIFALPLYILSLVVFLPLVGGGFFGVRLGAGPLPVIGNLALHLVYGAVLGAMFVLSNNSERARTEGSVIERAQQNAEIGAGLGVGFGLLLGGGVMLVTTLVIGSSMMDIVGGVVGGAVVGAALGLVLGSISSLYTEMKRAPVVASSVVIQPMMPPE